MVKIYFKYITVVFFAIWLILWVNFLLRDLNKGGHFNDYKILLFKNPEGKRSYTYGDGLFEFLEFCKKAIPESANYDLVGIEDISLDSRRSIYYLYPCIKKDNADFLLVFNKAGFNKSGYKLYRKLDNSRFVLKRD